MEPQPIEQHLSEQARMLCESPEVSAIAHQLYMDYQSQAYNSLKVPFPKPYQQTQFEAGLFSEYADLRPHMVFAQAMLGSESRLDEGTTYDHTLRVAKRIDDFISPTNGRREELMRLALMHDIASEKRMWQHVTAVGKNLIDAKLAHQLEGLLELESLGQEVRHVKHEEGFEPSAVGIVHPEMLKKFIDKYGSTVPFVAAVEHVDKLAHPIPNYLNDPKAWEVMHEDALEALYLHIPLMESLDVQPVVAALKTFVNLYLDREMSPIYASLLDEFTQPGFRNERELDIQNALTHTAKYIHLMEELYGYKFLERPVYHKKLKQAAASVKRRPTNDSAFYSFYDSMCDIFGDQKMFTISHMRDKSIGSAYTKALKYLNEVKPNWKEEYSTPSDRRAIIHEWMLSLPDLLGFEAVGYFDNKFPIESAKVLSFLHNDAQDPNQYSDPRNLYQSDDKRHPTLEITHRESGYAAVHGVYKGKDMTRTIEAHIFSAWEYAMQKVGDASHFAYKANTIGKPNGSNIDDVVSLFLEGLTEYS